VGVCVLDMSSFQCLVASRLLFDPLCFYTLQYTYTGWVLVLERIESIGERDDEEK